MASKHRQHETIRDYISIVWISDAVERILGNSYPFPLVMFDDCVADRIDCAGSFVFMVNAVL